MAAETPQRVDCMTGQPLPDEDQPNGSGGVGNGGEGEDQGDSSKGLAQDGGTGYDGGDAIKGELKSLLHTAGCALRHEQGSVMDHVRGIERMLKKLLQRISGE